MPTALITGGTTGIGRATALLLHARGYRVAVTGVNPASTARAKEELPRDITVITADAGDIAAVGDLEERVAERFESLDFLFLNAGTFHPAPLPTVTEDDFDRQVDVNFKGPYFTLQRLLPRISDGGAVVFTVGIASQRGSIGASLGAATRGALLTMIPTLALELAPREIRVNSVSPGMTDTPLLKKAALPEADREAMRRRIPFNRLGTSEDIAGTVAFLASDQARYITGQDITIAGGYGLSA